LRLDFFAPACRRKVSAPLREKRKKKKEIRDKSREARDKKKSQEQFSSKGRIFLAAELKI